MFTPNHYQPYMQQIPTAQPVQAQPQPQQNSGILWVQGESGAKSFVVAPGQSVLLMDSEESKFFIKTADQSGMPLPLRAFTYNEVTAEQKSAPAAQPDPDMEFITRKEFDALSKRISALQKKLKGEAENE